ncbi:MAG: tRNA (guanine37-N1)-methyltransferase [Actinomycetota bacterium]|jgi:tRNA (guanine37-N1)-methyltransferase|nr:tRNA (guanine37-N1)-methyltransferase [Actinomycetota bacterium]
MRFDVITIFPELFEAPLRTSLLGKAVEAGIMDVGVHDLRVHGRGKHRSVDDSPYGGGPGMVMRPEPIAAAIEELQADDAHTVLLSPRGKTLDHAAVHRLSQMHHVVLICGRYEGVDERVSELLVDEELSIGDFVLSGGEAAALVVIEAVSRLLPGVLGNEESLASESHSQGELEYPQYTRPAEWRGSKVPDVLLSGDHGAVERWRADEARRLTRERRGDAPPPEV